MRWGVGVGVRAPETGKTRHGGGREASGHVALSGRGGRVRSGPAPGSGPAPRRAWRVLRAGRLRGLSDSAFASLQRSAQPGSGLPVWVTPLPTFPSGFSRRQ